MYYEIAERFPEDVRRTVVELWRTGAHTKQGTRLQLPGHGPAEMDYCPLGLCFREMGIDDHAPDDEHVVTHFLSPLPYETWEDLRADEDIHELLEDAGEFLSAWDEGDIEDLAEAFGVWAP